MLDSTARYVYEVYWLKSVSNAANSLFISQPAISAAIRKAEKDFGAPIFNRKTLPFTLTEEGKIYIAALEKMLALAKGRHKHFMMLDRTLRAMKMNNNDYFSETNISLWLKYFNLLSY